MRAAVLTVSDRVSRGEAADGSGDTLEQLLEQRAARVLRLTAGDAVGDGEDGGLQTDSFVFSTSRTSATTIPLSIAFAMS